LIAPFRGSLGVCNRQTPFIDFRFPHLLRETLFAFFVRRFSLVTKSNLILGLGETSDEVRTALGDLRDAGCDIVTITQYLRPSARHHPVERWVKPEEFVQFARFAEGLGFAGVLAGPLVRSSYRAGRLYEQARNSRALASR
ncbi:hypothetical protein ABLN86_14975, partial [Mycobacterium tuberculosis]